MLPLTVVFAVNSVPFPSVCVNHPPNVNPDFSGALGSELTVVAGSVTTIELGFAAVSAF